MVVKENLIIQRQTKCVGLSQINGLSLGLSQINGLGLGQTNGIGLGNNAILFISIIIILIN